VGLQAVSAKQTAEAQKAMNADFSFIRILLLGRHVSSYGEVIAIAG
jgi:hypothetical protein